MFENLTALTSLLCAVSLIQTGLTQTPVKNCTNGELRPLSVQVGSCTEVPCDLWRGFDSNMAIQFVSTKNSVNNIQADVLFSTLGIGMPFELKPERTDVCKNLMYDAYCPMYKGEDATYHLVLNIAKHQPEVPAKIRVSLKDTSDGTILACFILDARITQRNGNLIS